MSQPPFKNGNIISLTLINFQTFKNTTISFSHSLNFIIGPNGSGKSTISNALSFIFGGNPKTIGKAKHLKEYIRFGEEKCKIEAKIYLNNAITVLSRSMSHTSNTYYINNENVKKNVYDEFMANLHININNLCQYLPQERVSEFVRMSPEELLVQTCLSLDRNSIVEDLNTIKEMEYKLSEVSNKEDVLNTERSNIKNVVDNIYKDVEKFKEKENKMLRVEMMESKKLWLEYEIMKSNYKRLTKNLKILKTALKEAQTNYDFYQGEIKNIKNSPLNLELNEKIKSFDTFDNQCKYKIEELKQKKTKIAYLDVDLEHINKRREKNIEDSKSISEEIVNLKADLEKMKTVIKTKFCDNKILKIRPVEQTGCKKKKLEDEEYVLQRVMGLFNVDIKEGGFDEVKIEDFLVEYDSKRLNETEDRLFEMKRRRNELLDAGVATKNLFDDLENKKKKINEEGERRLELLKRYHLDTYKAVLWYRDNKSQFKNEIIEPAFLNINITNEKYTAEVETFLGFTLLTSFICKDSRDFEKFMKLLKDGQRLSINAIEEIKNVDKREYSPEQIKSFGFDGCLLDFIDVCKETKDFLIAHGHFDSIPVSKSYVDEKTIFKDTNIKRFAMASKYVEIKRSRYNANDYVVFTSAIGSKNFFSKKIDTSEIEDRLRELSIVREKNSVELKSVYQEISIIEKKLKQLLSEKNTHDNNINDIQTRVNLYNMNLNTLCQKINILKSLKDDKELEIKEKEIKLDKEKIKQQMVSLKNSLISILRDEEYLGLVRDCMVIFKNIKSELKRLDYLESECMSLERVIRQETLEIDNNKALKDELKKSMEERSKKLLASSKRFVNSQNPSSLGEEQAQLCITSESMKLLPNTVEELNNEILKEKTQLKFFNVNEEAKLEYEEKKSQLDKIAIDLSKTIKNKKIYEGDIKAKREAVIKILDDLVRQINDEFKILFNKIGCEGRLEFNYKNTKKHDGGQNDCLNLESTQCLGELPCKNWKLNILVKFREKEKLEVLSSFRQSGGEKSVSTILFLLALQKIDNSPFRLVDEINQGMDRHNEKSILNILFDMCKEDDSTQFFIISPKLVEGLAYNENMKVIILFSDQPGAVKKAFLKAQH